MSQSPQTTPTPAGPTLAKPGRRGRIFDVAAKLPWWPVLRTYLATWHRLRFEGKEHLPSQGPFVMVSNHTSHLDTIALAAALPRKLRKRVRPIAAEDTFFSRHPMATLAARVMRAVPVSRERSGRHALGELRSALEDDGQPYILYPEGTRARDGRMGPFLSGLGLLVAGTQAPVVPCHIEGAYESMPAGAALPWPAAITVRIGQPIHFDHLPNRRRGWDAVAEQVESAVRRLSPHAPPPQIQPRTALSSAERS